MTSMQDITTWCDIPTIFANMTHQALPLTSQQTKRLSGTPFRRQQHLCSTVELTAWNRQIQHCPNSRKQSMRLSWVYIVFMSTDVTLCCVPAGQEFCVELRKTVPDAVVPVIMISAKTDEENIVNGLQHGCNDFIW